MIYTFYTDSHKVFLDDWFLKTIDEEEKDQVHIEKFDQECHSGSFMESGWNKTMLRKVDYIIDCISDGKVFIHADCDIQFFDKIIEDMQTKLEDNDLDILGQHDGNLWGIPTMCAGFFIAKPSDKLMSMFKEVRELVVSGKAGNDQLALNSLLNKGDYDVKFDFLDDSYYSIWRSNGIKEWTQDDSVAIPSKLRIHHSNYTAGIPNKLKLMELIREKYDANE